MGHPGDDQLVPCDVVVEVGRCVEGEEGEEMSEVLGFYEEDGIKCISWKEEERFVAIYIYYRI